MDVLYPRCAGLDVHKDTVVAGVRLAGNGPTRTEVRTFSTTALMWPWRRPAFTGSRSGTSYRTASSR